MPDAMLWAFVLQGKQLDGTFGISLERQEAQNLASIKRLLGLSFHKHNIAHGAVGIVPDPCRIGYQQRLPCMAQHWPNGLSPLLQLLWCCLGVDQSDAGVKRVGGNGGGQLFGQQLFQDVLLQLGGVLNGSGLLANNFVLPFHAEAIWENSMGGKILCNM